MGNCINKRAVVSWADDEYCWEDEDRRQTSVDMEKKDYKVIKIKISKKELQGYLDRLSSSQINEAGFAPLVPNKDHLSDHHWQPALHSIPETDF